MSLTVLIHSQIPSVAIVRWFRDARVTIDYAVSPIVQMPIIEFRSAGHAWVIQHFEEYAKIRIDPRNSTSILRPGEEKAVLEGRIAVWLKVDQNARFDMVPQVFERASIVGTKNLPRSEWQTIKLGGPAEEFWSAFDSVVATARAADS
jgi:hypothetical protein